MATLHCPQRGGKFPNSGLFLGPGSIISNGPRGDPLPSMTAHSSSSGNRPDRSKVAIASTFARGAA